MCSGQAVADSQTQSILPCRHKRVVIYVLEKPNGGGRDAAKQILGHAMCAERPLMRMELQGRFCIEIDGDTADPDFRLSRSCKSLYGSLVEVGKDLKSIASSDHVV